LSPLSDEQDDLSFIECDRLIDTAAKAKDFLARAAAYFRNVISYAKIK
jgi:hypothetical protein